MLPRARRGRPRPAASRESGSRPRESAGSFATRPRREAEPVADRPCPRRGRAPCTALHAASASSRAIESSRRFRAVRPPSVEVSSAISVEVGRGILLRRAWRRAEPAAGVLAVGQLADAGGLEDAEARPHRGRPRPLPRVREVPAEAHVLALDRPGERAEAEGPRARACAAAAPAGRNRRPGPPPRGAGAERSRSRARRCRA